MDYNAIAKNRQVKALTRFNECYALIMVIIFSLIPILAIISPQDFGPIFSGIGSILIYSLLFLGVFQILSYATFNSGKYSAGERLKFCMQKTFNSFKEHKVGIILLVFMVLMLISSFVAYFDGTQVIANLKYANQMSGDEAKTMYDSMSFTDTRIYKGTDFRPDGVFMYIVFTALFIFTSIIKDKKFKQIIFMVNIVSFAIISLIVLQQYYGIIGSAGVKEAGAIGKKLSAFYDSKGIRIGHFFKGLTGCFYNLNHVAYFMTVCTMLISGMVIMSKKVISKILWAVFAVYSYYIMIINDTFGCYLAVLIVLVVAGILKVVADLKLLEKGTYKIYKVCVNSFLPLILFVAVSVSFVAFSTEENTITKNFKVFGGDIKSVATTDDIDDEGGAGSGRMKMWVASGKMIKEKPVFGYGPDNLKAEYIEKKVSLDRAHNEPIEKAVSLGIPAAIVYYAAVILALVAFIKKRKNFKEATSFLPFMALVGYLVSSLFGVFLFYTAGYFVMMLAFVTSKEPEIINDNTKSTKKHR